MSNEGKTLEDIVLAGLTVKTSRLEAFDFKSSMFSDRQARPAFEFISREWEEHRPERIDPRQPNTSNNGVGEYLKSLIGWEPVNDEDFKRYYVQFCEARIKKSIARKTEAWVRSPAGVEPEDVRAEWDELERLRQGTIDDGQPTSLLLSSVESQRVPWLWQDYIPLGRATLVSGDPGCGKTWFVLDLAARLSRGSEWPDGSLAEAPAKTYYMTVEDDAHDTIRPRIDSLGGDPSMIAIYNAEHPLHLDLSTARGLKRLETELTHLTNVKLVVIDPILDFSGRVNPNAGEEVRSLLTPLLRLANKLNFALVLVGHLNKAQTMSAIYRAGGSTAGWLGKCRASFMVFRDVDDKALRRIVPIKANLAPQDPRALEFRIIDGRVETSISIEDVNLDEQLNPQQHRGPAPAERNRAVDWLNVLFAKTNEVPAVDVEAAAKNAGINTKTLQRAKKAAGFTSVQRNKDGEKVWFWVKQ